MDIQEKINANVNQKEYEQETILYKYEKELEKDCEAINYHFLHSNAAYMLSSVTERIILSTVAETAFAYVMIATNKYNYDAYIKVCTIDESAELDMFYKYVALTICDSSFLQNQYDDYIKQLIVTKGISHEDFIENENYQYLIKLQKSASGLSKYDFGTQEMKSFKQYLVNNSYYNNDENQDVYNIVNNYKKKNKEILEFIKEYNPLKIKEFLDQYVIGQDESKKAVSLAFYEHLVRVAYPERDIKKNNLLLIGPSGCGKTELLRTLKLISPVPIVFFDAAGLTQDGWKGNKKVSSIIESAVYVSRNCNHKMLPGKLIDKVQESIIFIDEFDKVIRPMHSGHGDNVSIDIQGEMLKLFEDGDFNVNGKLFFNKEDCCERPADINISAKNILIICAGAFSDLMEKNNSFRSIGFLADNKLSLNKKLNHEDIIKYGMMPELAGRISSIATLEPLTQSDYIKIMKNHVNSPIHEFMTTLEKGFGIQVHFAESAYYDIANHLIDGIGVRGIRTILSDLKKEIVYNETYGSTVLVTGYNSYKNMETEHILE
ncbi:AAA family ATPase [Enterocloster aldenensis]|uniref:AAA family ATPase n=1 Tax=Enterocloster aldenensis TaxID=358742 RepID=UPI000E4760EB|nr:AAA family ATPase [Enterocloster aldenensis]